jgi:NAD+ synthase (glutamine-hydrolysing)
MPLEMGGGRLLNCAMVIRRGRLLGIVPKTYLPNYKEFYEQRWFTSGGEVDDTIFNYRGEHIPLGSGLLFRAGNVSFGIELCEDLWAPIPPSSHQALQEAQLIFNLSASNESIGKNSYLRALIAQQSARCIAGYVYSSCGFGESTTDVVFAGNALIYENGTLLAEGKRFCFEPQLVVSDIDIERLQSERILNKTFAACRSLQLSDEAACQEVGELSSEPRLLHRRLDAHPFVPQGERLHERCEEILSIQVAGLAKRLVHTQAKSVVVGISGGLDSTLALLVCVRAFDQLGWSRKGILGVTMPGFGTTDRTHTNACNLMKELGVSLREVNIREACLLHFRDIGHQADVHDVVYENVQARERTQVLMDIANQTGGLVIGTGDLSELALGWATYNGDHMSMYGVNASVPKTLVRHLVSWVAHHLPMGGETRSTLLDIVDTPISPELIPATADGRIAQRTEELVGPYELHDFFLYHFLRFGFRPGKLLYLALQAFGQTYDEATVRHWLATFLRRFFQQQFKRSCLPDGPKVGSVSLSPRGDWRMPSDASVAEWLRRLEPNS